MGGPPGTHLTVLRLLGRLKLMPVTLPTPWRNVRQPLRGFQSGHGLMKGTARNTHARRQLPGIAYALAQAFQRNNSSTGTSAGGNAPVDWASSAVPLSTKAGQVSAPIVLQHLAFRTALSGSSAWSRRYISRAGYDSLLALTKSVGTVLATVNDQHRVD